MKWIATSSTASWHEKVPQPTEASPQLFVTDHRQQVISGFGGCFNEIGWQALQSLSEVFTLLHHYLSNGVNGFVYWNMVLPPGGRSTWGWTQNSLITVDAAQRTVTYYPEYYVMKHFAHFVAPGSVRLDLQGPWSGNAIAFHTPASSTVVVCANPFGEQIEVVMDVAGSRFSLCLDARSFNTVVFNG